LVDSTPRAVIPVSSIPRSPVRAIPVPVIEENIHFDFRRIIHIGTGYHDHGWRRRKDQAGQGNVDIDVDLCIASCRTQEAEHQKHGSDTEYIKQ